MERSLKSLLKHALYDLFRDSRFHYINNTYNILTHKCSRERRKLEGILLLPLCFICVCLNCNLQHLEGNNCLQKPFPCSDRSVPRGGRREIQTRQALRFREANLPTETSQSLLLILVGTCSLFQFRRGYRRPIDFQNFIIVLTISCSICFCFCRVVATFRTQPFRNRCRLFLFVFCVTLAIQFPSGVLLAQMSKWFQIFPPRCSHHMATYDSPQCVCDVWNFKIKAQGVQISSWIRCLVKWLHENNFLSRPIPHQSFV